ncbi:hypothetical protein SAMN05421810_102556 [Amycolatopsis arida]|uniref:Uncharacterized protein n=1 Tax=Amycolatopsis arida TaxID=587909 RepID=A0A1I5Q992_9PSEU|nr:hypothetical protein [Amycolatopsis arida]TDX98760.1 hypothetical protein CLV69_101557 [Amycolatopsis arida]SFP42819.1 hypothetical protein SAMN05421810_102556 [Amycolatopsis arida]
MTALRSWSGACTTPPEIGLAPGLIAEIMAEEFREIPRSGFPIALQPMIVPRNSYLELLSATAGLISLLRKAVVNLADDRPGRMAALGIDPADCPMFVPDEDFELRHCADMTRADVIIGPDGPKFIEFNVSGGFGGMAHFLLYQQAWHRIREAAGRPAFVAVDAFAQQARLIETTCAELGVPPSAVIVGTPRDWGPGTGSRVFDVQVNALRRHGVHATQLEFDDLLTGIGLPGNLRTHLGIAAFTVQDAATVGYDLSPVRAALDAGLLLVPSQSAWFLHTKKTLALLSEGQPWMTGSETELVRRYVPWSRVVGDREVWWRDTKHHLPRLLVDRKDDFVLKGATGCAGEEVFLGGTISDEVWSCLVEDAVRTGDFIVQERVETQPYPLDLLAESGEINRISATPVVSPFCLGGRAAGCYVRFTDEGHQASTIGGVTARRTCLLAEA